MGGRAGEGGGGRGGGVGLGGLEATQIATVFTLMILDETEL